MIKYRFGIREDMTDSQVKATVIKYTNKRRSEIREAESKGRTKLLNIHTNGIFKLPTAEIVAYSLMEPIDAVIETYVEEEHPELVKNLDSAKAEKFKARFLKDVVVGDKHIKLHSYVYELKDKEHPDLIIEDSAIVERARIDGMEECRRIREYV